MVLALQKSGADILTTLTPEKCNLWHHATGFAGEIFEVTLAINNNDGKNLVEEVGDTTFYLEGILLANGLPSVEEILKDQSDETIGSLNLLQESDLLFDSLKKHLIYGKDIDGDLIQSAIQRILVRLELALTKFDSSIEHAIEANKQKLVLGENARYPELAYSDKDALERKDKINA